jgi:hypothetical protein
MKTVLREARKGVFGCEKEGRLVARMVMNEREQFKH